ncbi:MAG TPA: glycosyltransferase [Gemmatimonadales bacterium]|nr:glycosyltransferase [Gemmatimonadales bacterium]
MTQGKSPHVPLSVIIATTKPWPEVRATLESLHGQIQDVGGEILVADGDGEGIPKDVAERYPAVRILSRPGASVFSLRGLAMAEARGEVIAVTEDHCVVTPGWCNRILAAHQAHPEVAAIGGLVENGATTRLIDWANFLIVFGPFTAPIESGPRRAISLQANISYKRRVIPKEAGELGMMEMLFNRRLREQGELLLADDRLLVYHVQSWGFWGTFAAHFHNGRSIAGFRLAQMGTAERLARLAGCALLPPVLWWRTVWPVLRKGRLVWPALASLPLTGLIAFCHAAGEFVGYVAGPGGSPRKLA